MHLNHLKMIVCPLLNWGNDNEGEDNAVILKCVNDQIKRLKRRIKNA